ncbi:hypothetical protein HYQ44_019601 [Verticillium longisporum]|nr:hypothetical protein HYQ44_019601 [Verticillium longisporum]
MPLEQFLPAGHAFHLSPAHPVRLTAILLTSFAINQSSRAVVSKKSLLDGNNAPNAASSRPQSLSRVKTVRVVIQVQA